MEFRPIVIRQSGWIFLAIIVGAAADHEIRPTHRAHVFWTKPQGNSIGDQDVGVEDELSPVSLGFPGSACGNAAENRSRASRSAAAIFSPS